MVASQLAPGKGSSLILRLENLADISTECFSLHHGERLKHSVQTSERLSDLKVGIRELPFSNQKLLQLQVRFDAHGINRIQQDSSLQTILNVPSCYYKYYNKH